MRQPKLIVFDLDYTLWPFWADTHIQAPITKKSDGKVYDGSAKQVKYFEDVPKILKELKEEGYTLAIASRSGWSQGCQRLLDLFEWNDYFSYKQIYPGSKVTHFNKIKRMSGIEFEEMLFFDDEVRNTVQVQKLGVSVCLIDSEVGLTKGVLESSLKYFLEKSSK